MYGALGLRYIYTFTRLQNDWFLRFLSQSSRGGVTSDKIQNIVQNPPLLVLSIERRWPRVKWQTLPGFGIL